MSQDSPATDAGTPDHWAPINRRTMRDDVDRFRNERMPVPATMADARELAALALEYFEHAHEVKTRTSKALDALREERRAWDETADDSREAGVTMQTMARESVALFAKLEEAEKELAVAGRRHATALAYLNTFKGE